MERVNKLIKHTFFLENLQRNVELEKDRQFCRHDLAHFLDVARIGRIINLEEQLGIADELIYAAALLHDIGKHLQYTDGIPHEQASARLASVILQECGFEETEIAIVTDAIAAHRDSLAAGEKNLRGVLYRADKASRPCFACEAEKDCNWKKEKKNRQICY